MLVLSLLVSFVTCRLVDAASNETYLQATAIVTNAQNHSQLECWQFTKPVTSSSDAGTAGAATFTFPQANDTVYTVIPPRFSGGIHNAPVPQWVDQDTRSFVADSSQIGRLLLRPSTRHSPSTSLWQQQPRRSLNFGRPDWLRDRSRYHRHRPYHNISL